MTERTLAEAFAAGQLAVRRPEAGADRRARAGLWLCPDEYRRPFSALGRRGRRRRAHGGSDPRPVHRRHREASPSRGSDATAAKVRRMLRRRQIHCVFMTVQLRFCDAIAGSGCARRLLVLASQGRGISAGSCCVGSMAPAPNPGPSAAALAGGIAALGIWRLLAVAAPQLGGVGRDAADRDRFRLAHRLSAVLGNPELLLDRAAAPPGAVGRAVADPGRGAGAAVAAQARRRADDREFRRPDGDRPRHRGVPVHDLPQSALVGDRRRRSSPFR